MSQSKDGEGGIYNVTNLNLYHYAGNNPIKYVDPNGKSATNEVMGVGGAVVTGVEISYAIFTLAELFEKYGVIGGGIMLLLLLLQGDTQPSIEINSVEVPQQFGETQAEDTKKELEDNAEAATSKPNTETKKKIGTSKAPETSEPNTEYEQVDNNGNVRSKTYYGENGKPAYRDDFQGKEHYVKGEGYIKPHRHDFFYNSNNQPIGENVIPIPE